MLQIRRLGYALGARVEGLDVTQPLERGDDRHEIRRAWGEHLVLCFPRTRSAPPNEQSNFCSRFGEIDVKLKPPGALAGNPEVALIANMAIDVEGQAILPARADEWHSDLSFSDPGPARRPFCWPNAYRRRGRLHAVRNAPIWPTRRSPAMHRLGRIARIGPRRHARRRTSPLFTGEEGAQSASATFRWSLPIRWYASIPGDGAESAVRRQLAAPLRRDDRRGVAADSQLLDAALDALRVHLPASLDGRRPFDVGHGVAASMSYRRPRLRP